MEKSTSITGFRLHDNVGLFLLKRYDEVVSKQFINIFYSAELF